MKLPTYQWLGQMFATLGVILSLGFVAYELKLSRDTAMADIFQQRNTAEMEHYGKLVDNVALHRAWNKVSFTGEPLTPEDIMLMTYFIDGWMQSKESIFYQTRLGLSDQDEWAVHQAMISTFGYMPCYAKHWDIQRKFYRADFVQLVDRLWGDVEIPDCPSSVYPVKQ